MGRPIVAMVMPGRNHIQEGLQKSCLDWAMRPLTRVTGVSGFKRVILPADLLAHETRSATRTHGQFNP
jgi:hypothetical protein